MDSPAQDAAKFIRELSALADRLAERDIVVASLNAQYAFFGCWQLVAHKNDEAVRFFTDGRDCYVTVEISPIHGHSSPNEWKQETASGFDGQSGISAIQFVEQYLQKRFPK